MPAHPLSRATEAVTGATRQWLTCAAIPAGSIVAELEGHTWATVLTIGSAPVLAALAILLLILKQRVSDRAIDLIGEGRETPNRDRAAPPPTPDGDFQAVREWAVLGSNQ